jgi:hypothetical protein
MLAKYRQGHFQSRPDQAHALAPSSRLSRFTSVARPSDLNFSGSFFK